MFDQLHTRVGIFIRPKQNCFNSHCIVEFKMLSSEVYFLSLRIVRCMMYGFGDDQAPFTESVDLLEDLVIEYISEMVSYNF